MNAGVNSEKEKVKESQSQSTKGGTPARHPHRVPGRGRHSISEMGHSGWYFIYSISLLDINHH